MAERRWWPPRAAVAGLCAGLAVMTLGAARPESWREDVFDLLLGLAAPLRPATGPLPRFVFVDIDAASLTTIGPWPWPRETLARLVARTQAPGPKAIAIDILLAEPDTRSPAALARRLAGEAGRADLADLAGTLTDGDRDLAEAIAAARAALGFVLDPRGRSEISRTPVLKGDGAGLGMLWTAAGMTGATPALADAAAGMGAMSLPGDADGTVRRVPLFVSVAGEPYPGLGIEALRLATGASGYLVADAPVRLRIGDLAVPMPRDGLLRLAPRFGDAPVTLSAAALLEGRVQAADLHDAIVFIGGSAPELGGLRASVSGPLTPSTRIQIEAARQFAAGIVPQRPRQAGPIEAGLAALTIAGAILFGRWLSPQAGSAALAATGALVGLSAVAAAVTDRLVDPSVALASGLVAFVVTALWTFSEARLRESRIRRRFEQHLAPDVVKRIVADPASLKLSGERRVVTAMFTDIEGFTAMTRRIEPETLVAVLDGYFGGVTAIVVAHGGTVDKFVGDAVHALFNAPLDMPDHARKAVACAVALLAWTETYRGQALPAAAGLGRTRIGLETGPAIVGDVGFGAKLDYTAHGDAVNTASRLEALNKQLKSSICIGPVAAALCEPSAIRLLARVEIAGVGELDVFTPLQAS